MAYEVPVKLQDGRYFVKASEPTLVTVNNATLANRLTDDDIRLNLSNADVEIVNQWDAKFIDAAAENSAVWFQREMARDAVASYYQSALDDNTMEVQASTDKKGKVNVHCFDHANNIVSDVSGTCRLLLRFEGLWFLRKTFGPVWKVLQCKMRKVPEPVKCLIADDDEEDEE